MKGPNAHYDLDLTTQDYIVQLDSSQEPPQLYLAMFRELYHGKYTTGLRSMQNMNFNTVVISPVFILLLV